uniref:Uncharacterized protein n=1 Tax=Leersia perrieri TaxID=77586 RepID=A0A0D9XNA2_9ORYZ
MNGNFNNLRFSFENTRQSNLLSSPFPSPAPALTGEYIRLRPTTISHPLLYILPFLLPQALTAALAAEMEGAAAETPGGHLEVALLQIMQRHHHESLRQRKKTDAFLFPHQCIQREQRWML